MAVRELFLPLEDADILVPGERVYYRRRRHVAVLIQPVLECAAGVTLFLWMTLGRPALLDSLLVTVALAIGLYFVGQWFLRIDWKRPRVIARAAAAALLIYATQADMLLLALLFVFWLLGRAALRASRWYWFRRIIITDRRVIEVDGLLSSRVASMPLARVTDAMLYRSMLAEILGYGEFRVESAGQDQALARINFLDDPDRFHSLIVQLAASVQPHVPQEQSGKNPPLIFDQGAS